MKKYATVETAKSTRILTSALTWFFVRTVPSSRNAKPACIASTMIAPSRMNSASPPARASFMVVSSSRRCSRPVGRSGHFGIGRGRPFGVDRDVGEVGLGHLDDVQVGRVALGVDLDVDRDRGPADALDLGRRS